MSRDHLIRRPVVDRNGVVSNRWTKPEEAAQSPAKPSEFRPLPPLPMVGSHASPAADELKEEIFAELKKTRGDRGLRSVIDEDAVRKAHKLNEVAALEAMLVCASFEGAPALSEVHDAYKLLQRSMVPEPERFLTPETVNFTHRMKLRVLESQRDNGGSEEVSIDELRCFALTADPADYPLIKRVIVERGVTDVAEAEAMIIEMKKDAASLSEGVL